MRRPAGTPQKCTRGEECGGEVGCNPATSPKTKSTSVGAAAKTKSTSVGVAAGVAAHPKRNQPRWRQPCNLTQNEINLGGGSLGQPPASKSTSVGAASDGGDTPFWRGDGKELFYASVHGIMAVPIASREGRPMPGPPERLFSGKFDLVGVTADGSRLRMIVNWINGSASPR